MAVSIIFINLNRYRTVFAMVILNNHNFKSQLTYDAEYVQYVLKLTSHDSSTLKLRVEVIVGQQIKLNNYSSHNG